MNKLTSVTSLTRTVNFDSNNEGGIDVRMSQVRCVSVECAMRGNAVVKVTAIDGISFKSACGMTLDMPAGAVITDLCDLPFLAGQIAEEESERAYDKHATAMEQIDRVRWNGVREFVA